MNLRTPDKTKSEIDATRRRFGFNITNQRDTSDNSNNKRSASSNKSALDDQTRKRFGFNINVNTQTQRGQVTDRNIKPEYGIIDNRPKTPRIISKENIEASPLVPNPFEYKPMMLSGRGSVTFRPNMPQPQSATHAVSAGHHRSRNSFGGTSRRSHRSHGVSSNCSQRSGSQGVDIHQEIINEKERETIEKICDQLYQ